MGKHKVGDIINTNLILEKDNSKRYYWFVQCLECGSIRSVRNDNLHQQCKSCAAKNRKHTLKDDLTGKRFGKWTVLYKSKKPNYWHCKCDCGTERDVFRGNLTQGMSKSCGCEKSWGEAQIRYNLQKNNICFISEYSFKDFVTEKNGYPRFDFAIFNNNKLFCLIEYDGRQHDIFNNTWHKTKEEFERLKYIDNLKNNYCEVNNINLIRLNLNSDIEKEILKIKEQISSTGGNK